MNVRTFGNIRNFFVPSFLLLFFIGGLFLSTLAVGHAQLRVGLRLAPTIGYSRVNLQSERYEVESSPYVRFAAGVFVEFELSDRYHLNLGLHYSPRSILLELQENDQTFEEIHRLQYLLFTPTFKFLTGEIFSYTRMFFEVGPTFDVKLHERLPDKISDEERFLVKQVGFIDLGINLGFGFEVTVGPQMDLGVGIAYLRGLINQVSRKQNLANEDVLLVRQDRFELGLYIKL